MYSNLIKCAKNKVQCLKKAGICLSLLKELLFEIKPLKVVF